MKEISGKPYQNPNINWNDFYSSTIVVPIRIKRRYIEAEYVGEGFDILGFLCADSNSTSAFPDREMESYVDTVKAFADTLYIYIDRILYYKNNLCLEG